MAIMGMKLPDDNTLEQTFANFETEMSCYEMAAGNQLPDSAKVGILVSTITGRLHEHLVLNVTEETRYAQVRAAVMNYTKSKKLTTKHLISPATDGSVPMDVDGIKGGTKGQKKYCTICQREGHWTSDCYYNPESKNYIPGKSKGKPSQKGKDGNYDGKKGKGFGKNNDKGKNQGKSKEKAKETTKAARRAFAV